jgi:choice-of-anchor B domain-containing protein
MKSIPSFLKIAPVVFLGTVALALIAGSGVFAHDDSMPGNGQIPPHARDTMRAFHDDHHHNENLSAEGITACSGGVAGTYPCSNVDLMAFLPLAQIGGGNGNDVWGWTDPATGKEFAIMGLTNGTAFVDISDPVNPVYYGHLPPPAGVSNSSWRDIKVYADHAFIGSEALGSGLQVFDLTVLRDGPSLVDGFVETAHYTGFSTSHNIVINTQTGYAYAVGTNNGVCARGIHFVDISDPANPQAAGCFADDGYTHDAQCVTYAGLDFEHAGKEICFAFNEDTLTIVDVTDKAAPAQLSRTGYANRGYSHQGWLTEDHGYLLLDDELDERNLASVTNTRTLIWDVRDLDNPDYFGDYFGPSTAIDHNQYVVGDYTYQANYRSGLRVLDISDIANGNLAEVAFFDIYPASDSANFNGAWSVYPFFASGNVVVSGIEQGLFILRPQLGVPGTPPTVSIVAPPDGGPNPLAGTVEVRIDASDAEDPAGTLTVEWRVDDGPWQSAAWDEAEYMADWDTTTAADGPHLVSARAIDSDLSAATVESNVTVANGALEFTVDASQVSAPTGRGNRNYGQALVVAVDEDGNPVDGVSISGTFSGDWSGTQSGTTDPLGEVVLTTPTVKNLGFVAFCVDSAAKAGWGWDIAGSTLCGDSTGAGAFGTVRGSVIDAATGSGISNAAVSADTGQSTTTDAFGEYIIANVPIGERTVTATASGYGSQEASATVSEGVDTFVNFALAETPGGAVGAVRGTVYASTGGKIAGVTVEVRGGSSSLTNKGGKYTIQSVPAGLQTVIAWKTGYRTVEQEVSVPPGSSVTLDFTLTPQ